MPKVLFQLYIEVEQHEYITKKSEALDISRAAFVRELIQKEMKIQGEGDIKKC